MERKIITHIHSCLPKSKKATELETYFRRLLYATFTPDEYQMFLENLQCLVASLNTKYPKTKEWIVDENPYSPSVSVRIDSTDKNAWVAFSPILKSYTDVLKDVEQ